MLMIAELVFTVLAWRRGWRWKALIPLAVSICMGFLIVMALATAGLSELEVTQVARVLGVFIDLGVLGVLIWMFAKGTEQWRQQRELVSGLVVSSVGATGHLHADGKDDKDAA